MSRALRVFISYAREDKEDARRLRAELQELEVRGLFSVWQDADLRGSEMFADEIKSQIEKSDFMALLISRDFLISRYCGLELKMAAPRVLANKCKLLPILVDRAPGWEVRKVGKMKLGSVQVLPSNSSPVRRWSSADQAWQTIAREMDEIAVRSGAVVPEVSRAKLLEKVCKFVMNTVMWRFDMESWMHNYDFDPEADAGLYGKAQVRREVDRIRLIGYGNSNEYDDPQTEAAVDCAPELAEFTYRETEPINRIRFRYALRFSSIGEIVADCMFSDAEMKRGHIQQRLSLTDFVDFLARSFRKQMQANASKKRKKRTAR